MDDIAAKGSETRRSSKLHGKGEGLAGVVPGLAWSKLARPLRASSVARFTRA